MLNDITAPAPRFILRLLCIKKYLNQHIKYNNPIQVACEIGPGLGDSASFMLNNHHVESWDLYESGESARAQLQNRFHESHQVSILSEFHTDNIAPSKYGLVMCCEVIEHVEEDELFLKLIHKSVSSNGLFIGSVPAYRKKWQSIDELAGHYRRYEKFELHKKLEAAGFEVLTIACYGFPLINMLYPLRETYYRSQLKKNRNSTKSEATARSGIARGLTKRLNKRPIFFIAKAFSLFQSLPFLSHFGDGFIFVARKKN